MADALFALVTVATFGVFIAYAAWCERQ